MLGRARNSTSVGWIVITLGLAVCACAFPDAERAGSASGAVQPSRIPREGAPAPEVVAVDVLGHTHRLSRLRDHVVVLGFLSPGITAQDDASERSSSQLVKLRSMVTQYSARGVAIMAVDADGTDHDHHDDLVNYVADRALPGPLLVGVGAAAATDAYAVTVVPTVVVIDREGRIVRRWSGLAPSQELAGALEQVARPVQPSRE